MENSKKNRVKINAFDVFLILLVLCLIATAAFRIYNGVSEDKNSYNSEYILNFTCEGEYNSIIKYVKDGDAVYLQDGELLGYITFAEGNEGDTPLEIIIDEENPDDEANSEVANDNANTNELSFVRFSGAMTLNGNAKKSQKGNYYIIGEDNITEGAKFTVHTINAEFTITVVSIEKVDKY